MVWFDLIYFRKAKSLECPQELSAGVHLVCWCRELVGQSHLHVSCALCNMRRVEVVVDVHPWDIHWPLELKGDPRCLFWTLPAVAPGAHVPINALGGIMRCTRWRHVGTKWKQLCIWKINPLGLNDDTKRSNPTNISAKISFKLLCMQYTEGGVKPFFVFVLSFCLFVFLSFCLFVFLSCFKCLMYSKKRFFNLR